MKFRCQLGILINTINAEFYDQSFQILKASVLHTLRAKTPCYTGHLSDMGSVGNTWNAPQKKVITIV